MNCANHPDRERVSFCQHCGKPLCAECSRTIGAGVFCEPCLAARLAGVDAAPFGTQTAAGVPIPNAHGGPNPGLAALLGFIPGVGAMYNGQYAKGVVHLIVFAVLVSLADSNGIFGLFVAGWEFYMAFEAYHTARARRDGTVLPNPFGLNDIGERFGFGKSWMPGTGAPTVYPAAPAGTHVTQDAGGNVNYASADRTVFTQSASGGPTYTGSAAPPTDAWSTSPPYSQPFSHAAPPAPAYMPVAGDSLSAPAPQNRFPTGAIVLIGLGLIFFFGSTGILRGFPVHRILPFFVIGFGVWLFVRKMTSTGQPLEDDGSPLYQQRVFAALRGSVWVVLVGILFLLDTFNVLSWARSWPLFIILAGIMALLQRYAYPPAAAAFPYTPGPVPPAPVGTVTSTGVVPTQEGR